MFAEIVFIKIWTDKLIFKNFDMKISIRINEELKIQKKINIVNRKIDNKMIKVLLAFTNVETLYDLTTCDNKY